MGEKLLVHVFAGLVLVVLAWTGISVMTERNVKEPTYALARSGDGYEVRHYDSSLVAEVKFPPNTENPLGEGFRILFKYIGGKTKPVKKSP